MLDHLQEVGQSARPEVVPDPAIWLRNSPISIRASCSGPLRHLSPQLLRFYAPIGGSLDRSVGCFPAVMMSVRSYDRYAVARNNITGLDSVANIEYDDLNYVPA